eukprot:COSAG01_NODE_5662_length_4113_cov_3.017190_7_plen_71_part_00
MLLQQQRPITERTAHGAEDAEPPQRQLTPSLELLSDPPPQTHSGRDTWDKAPGCPGGCAVASAPLAVAHQ